MLFSAVFYQLIRWKCWIKESYAVDSWLEMKVKSRPILVSNQFQLAKNAASLVVVVEKKRELYQSVWWLISSDLWSECGACQYICVKLSSLLANRQHVFVLILIRL